MLRQFRRTFLTLGVWFVVGAWCNASTIAITEFIIDPFGTDETAPEWVELFNYGQASVDIGGYTLKDNSSAIYTFPTGFTIPSGGYAIAARNRANFVTNWLGGVDDLRVAATDTGFVLNNSAPGDGLYLRNSGGDLIWSVGYQVSASDPINPYRATFLTIDDFSVNNYGQPPQAGTALIVRNGMDGTGTLGYEDNNITADAKAYASSTGSGQQLGSPLLGHYTVVPEPNALVLLCGLFGGIGVLSRRR